MPKDDSINLRQDRRQWLKASATVLGASLLPLPAVGSEAPQPEPQAPPSTPHAESAGTKSAAHFFTPSQNALVEELSETIIPADSHSGGAKAAKVADFIDQYLRETSDDNQKALWREGLRLIDLMSQHYTGKSFVDASPEERIEVFTVLSDHDQMTDLTEVRFYKDLKHLTVRGYYTSKIGIHDELEYKGNRIQQEFSGCDDQPTTS
jgi:Gluconate 2-dehydrogenase subunit 3